MNNWIDCDREKETGVPDATVSNRSILSDHPDATRNADAVHERLA